MMAGQAPALRASRPKVRFRLVEGRCHQGLADVAERRGAIETVQEPINAAGEPFAKCGAKLYLDQALAKSRY
jgi:hypothetical protein